MSDLHLDIPSRQDVDSCLSDLAACEQRMAKKAQEYARAQRLTSGQRLARNGLIAIAVFVAFALLVVAGINWLLGGIAP